MKIITKAAALTLAGAMALTCASCGLIPGLGGAKTEDIVDAADTFAKALASCDAGKIATLTNDSDAAEDLEELFGSEEYTDEQKAIADAVADTIEYAVDEESVKIDKDEASVDVTFTMADYKAALEGDFADADEAVAAIKDCKDTCEVEVTFEFVLEDYDWLVSNLSDKAYAKLYGFYGLDVSFTPDLALLIEDAFVDADNNYLYMTVYFSEDISDYSDKLVFDVFLDSENLMTDEKPFIDGDVLWCDYTADGPLESGTYTITLSYLDDVVVNGSVDVDNTSSGDPSFFEGDVFVCVVDFGDFIEDSLQDNGIVVDMEGPLILDLYLTLGADGTYKLEPDLDTFEPNLEEYLYNNMDEQNMMAFVGVSSAEDLEATAAEMNTDVDGLKDILIAAMVDSSIANVTGDVDEGTYEFDGDTICFYSDSLFDFEGTLESDGSISLVNDYFAPAPDYVMEFYYVEE